MKLAPADWHTVVLLLPLFVPLTYGLAATWPTRRHLIPWARAQGAAAAALALSLIAALASAIDGGGTLRLLTVMQLGPLGTLDISVRLDALSSTMLLLVCFIGGVILRYSRRYLDGDPGQAGFLRWYLATLTAVTLLVVANNLLLLTLAWIGTSLALHRLLLFYPDRVPAQVAAHKKFIASRVADLCLLGAVALIGLTFGSLEIDQITARAASLGALPASLQGATLLLVGGAALKCAQVPFHGWLIQVMEAPTPVSALLHAGVVNIGGFLMILLAPLMVQAEFAQTLLVLCGTTTAVVAALVMSTRVSIKVALAWSTCAQMGFMLLECGLGAYALALLHLVGHSLYKAHAFLTAGSTVDQWRAQAQAPALPPTRLRAWAMAAALALLAVALVAAAYGADLRREPALWALALIVALALTPLMARGADGGWLRFAMLAGASVAVVTLYFSWHSMFGRLLPGDSAASTAQIVIVIGGFTALATLYLTISTKPYGRIAQWLQPHLFAGLYLDELFTRFTFRVWPPRRPREGSADRSRMEI
jgi:NAD(P)H-quinone oxidoreductase subunit 5